MSLLSKYNSFIVGIMITASLLSCTPENNEVSQREKPNVLFIAIDDLNDWVGTFGGHKQALTPNIDNFANESVSFSNAYCASPGCNPSRSALLSGRHTFRTGMYSNYQDWRLVPEITDFMTLPHYFKDQGYFTAGAGKIFHYQQVDTLAWHDYFPSIKRPMPREIMPEKRPVSMPRFKYMYGMFDWAPIAEPDSLTGDYRSVEYIIDQLERDHENPFFLSCGIYRPHLPWYVPQRYFDAFPLDSIRLPKILNDDVKDLGSRAKELITRGGNYHKHVVAADQWKMGIQGYLASTYYADAMVGRLLDALAKSRYADNTIVVLWSDHGWQLGEKEHWRKFALWDNVIKSILMIKVPNEIQGIKTHVANSSVVGGPVSLLDIYPTLLDLCDLPQREKLDGQILTPWLKNPAAPNDRSVISTYDYGDYSVRWGDWHLISYIDGSYELYNLKDDPEEWKNLADEAQYSELKSKMIAMIPTDVVDLPEASLIPLMEHHIPPVRSKSYYESDERRSWMQRFETN